MKHELSLHFHSPHLPLHDFVEHLSTAESSPQDALILASAPSLFTVPFFPGAPCPPPALAFPWSKLRVRHCAFVEVSQIPHLFRGLSVTSRDCEYLWSQVLGHGSDLCLESFPIHLQALWWQRWRLSTFAFPASVWNKVISQQIYGLYIFIAKITLFSLFQPIGKHRPIILTEWLNFNKKICHWHLRAFSHVFF